MGFGLVRYSARASITLNQLAGWLRPKSEGAGEGGWRTRIRSRDRDKRRRTEKDGGEEADIEPPGECQPIKLE